MTTTARDSPDFTEIVDGLYIGNLASATTLPDHPEHGITHVLSVCHDYPAEAAEVPSNEGAGTSSCSTATLAHPRHHHIAVHDSEYEALLPHLPAAVAFIKDALDAPAVASGGSEGVESDVEAAEDTGSARKQRVLVHCVMGISRSVTVVCAYLMATRGMSPSAALKFIQRRRPQAQPNYGFRRQLAIFGEQRYFADLTTAVTAHPSYSAWMRKCNREARRFLARMDNIVSIGMDEKGNGKLSMTDDFPTDPVEAACLLSDLEVTHFLSVSPAEMPPLPPSPPSPAISPRLRPEVRPLLQHACLQLLPLTPIIDPSGSQRRSPDSVTPSPHSSRSSSFSSASPSASVSGPASPSTAATSVLSLPSLGAPSKLRLETAASSSDSDFEGEEGDAGAEPTFLSVARARHYHLPIPASEDVLYKMREGALFVHRSLEGDDFADFEPQQHEAGKRGRARSGEHGGNGDLRREDWDRETHVLVYSSTENRACAVICAYFMAAWGAPPAEAFDFLKEDQPLFNPTKGFMTQVERFHAAGCDPSPASGSAPDAAIDDEDDEDDDVFEHAGTAKRKSASPLLRRLGTPARCGSFATPVRPAAASAAHSCNASNPNAASTSTSAPVDWGSTPQSCSGNAGASGPGGVDDAQLEALLRRCEGAGAPGFAFDVEAFRGALRAVESRDRERSRR